MSGKHCSQKHRSSSVLAMEGEFPMNRTFWYLFHFEHQSKSSPFHPYDLRKQQLLNLFWHRINPTPLCLGRKQKGSEAESGAGVCHFDKLRLKLTAPAVFGSSLYIFALHPQIFFLSSPVSATSCPTAGAFEPSLLFFSSQFHREQLCLSLISMCRPTGCYLSRTWSLNAAIGSSTWFASIFFFPKGKLKAMFSSSCSYPPLPPLDDDPTTCKGIPQSEVIMWNLSTIKFQPCLTTPKSLFCHYYQLSACVDSMLTSYWFR